VTQYKGIVTLRILIVENGTLIGKLLAELLREMGHDVWTVEADEVSFANQFKPDLMIADGQAGDGRGVSVIEEILRTWPVPYLLMGGRKMPLQRPGAVWLQTPFREVDLVEAIQFAFGITVH